MTTRDYRRLHEEIISLVIALSPEPDRAVGDVSKANFIDDLGYHSVALVELGFAVEEQFGLEPIEAEDVEDVVTPEDLARFVADRLGINPNATT
jgi:acyl carrier protein